MFCIHPVCRGVCRSFKEAVDGAGARNNGHEPVQRRHPPERKIVTRGTGPILGKQGHEPDFTLSFDRRFDVALFRAGQLLRKKGMHVPSVENVFRGIRIKGGGQIWLQRSPRSLGADRKPHAFGQGRGMNRDRAAPEQTV